MSASTFRLVFQGNIAPDQELVEVKGRLQKLFKKDAATIDKMFTGKKVALKQGLTQAQAQQYQQKMRSLGVLCAIESQAAPSTRSAGAGSPASSQRTAPAPENAGTRRETLNNGGHSVEASNSESAADQKPLKLADIDKAFSGTIPKVELPNSYKAGIVAVGITMVLLPIIYIGLIAMLGYGVLSHSISNVSWIQSLGYKFGFIAYITPIIVGLTVMLFMIKPLFARPAAAATTIKLDPLKEPIFFHFVNKIALAVGAPRPKQIEVDCQVNASASFRKGLFSFFGDDLVLTIGMPLLAGFNARQLAGVLAHEFGHFSQGVGMRFHYLTYKVNSWFFNAVYLRDSWDMRLEQEAEEADGWISVILNFARGGVWATRKVLYGFMMAGHAVSSYMLRQMEFDADRYEAHMAGSDQFKNTTLQLQRLGVAFQISHDQLVQAWEDKKLVDNLPRLIAHNATQLPDELDRALLNQMREAQTQVYDSHPSDNERIDNAMQQQAKGIFSLARQSQELFKSFDAIAKQVSNSYYAHELGLDFDKNKLVDVNQVVQITKDNEKQQEAYHQYFKDMAPVFELPISVNIFDTSKVDWDELLSQYQQVNEQIINQIAQRRKLMAQANESYDKYQKLLAIDIFRESGFVIFPEWVGMDEQTFAKYKEMIPKLEQTWLHAMGQLQPMFALNDERLSIALTLVNHPVLLERNPDHAQHLKIRNRYSLLINNFKRNTEYVTDFELAYFKLNALLTCAPLMGQKPEAMSGIINGLLESVKQSYEQLTAALGRLDYPFVAEGEHLTIADYIADFLPNRNHCSSELQYYMQSGEVTLEKLELIYARIISGLANIALTIDGLIPDMNKPYQANEQVQLRQELQQQVANGLPLDTPSNMAYQEANDTSEEDATPSDASTFNTMSKPEASAAKEKFGKATFAIDESGNTDESSSAQSQSEYHESSSTDVTVNKAVEPIMDTKPEDKLEATDSTSGTNALEENSGVEKTAHENVSVENNSPVTNGLSLEPATENPVSKKTVFTIDDSADTQVATELKSVPEVSAEPARKAVFSIDDPMDKPAEEEQPSQVKPDIKSTGKAVFAIDESVDTTEANDSKTSSNGTDAVEADAAQDTGLNFETSVSATTAGLNTQAQTEKPVVAESAETQDKPKVSGGLSLETIASPESEATKKVAAPAETTDNNKQYSGLSLSLEPVEEEAAKNVTHEVQEPQRQDSKSAETTAESEAKPKAELFLETLPQTMAMDQAATNDAATSMSLEPVEAQKPADTATVTNETVSNTEVLQTADDMLQNSLVTESKAAVVAFGPAGKSDSNTLAAGNTDTENSRKLESANIETCDPVSEESDSQKAADGGLALELESMEPEIIDSDTQLAEPQADSFDKEVDQDKTTQNSSRLA